MQIEKGEQKSQAKESQGRAEFIGKLAEIEVIYTTGYENIKKKEKGFR